MTRIEHTPSSARSSSPKVRSPKRGRPVDPALAGRRQEQILRVASRLFARRGFGGTDLQDVADVLKVGKGTIYRYFPSKSALFQAAVDRVMIDVRAGIDAAMLESEDPLDRIGLAIRAYLRYFNDHPESVELLIQERAVFRDRKKPTYFQYREANAPRWQEIYRGLMAAGRIREMPADRITDVIGDLLYGTMFTNYMAGRTRSLADQSHDIVDVLMHGLLTPEERARRPLTGIAHTVQEKETQS